MRRSIITGLLTLLLAAAAVRAQQPPAAAPGLVPLDELNLFPRDKLSTEVNLEGALLRLVAAATKKENPDFSAFVSGLRSINVQVFPLKGEDAESIKPRIVRAVRWLEDHGWKANVRVREKGEETYIYIKEQNGQILGLTVLTFEAGEEAAVINISGRIDPAQIGRLGQELDLPQLDKVRPPKGKKPQ